MGKPEENNLLWAEIDLVEKKIFHKNIKNFDIMD